jgi:hypothetical protein
LTPYLFVNIYENIAYKIYKCVPECQKKNLLHVNVIASLTYMKGILTNFPLLHQQYQVSTIIKNPSFFKNKTMKHTPTPKE